MRARSLAAITVAVATLPALAAEHDTTYSVEMLPTFGGSFSVALGLNDLGHACGHARDEQENWRAFRWTPARGMVDLGGLGGTDSWSTAINNLDVVAGSALTASPVVEVPVLWKPGGGVLDLRLPSAGINSINNRGEAVGAAILADGARVPVFWDARHRRHALPALPGGPWFNHATSINDLGQIVGTSSNRPALWPTPEIVIDLGTLGGVSGDAWDINRHGVIVGHAETAARANRPFVWDRLNGMQQLPDIGEPPNSSATTAKSINDLGQIVGDSDNGQGPRAAIWTDGRVRDLNHLVPPGTPGILIGAWCINNQGQIAAVIIIGGGVYRGAILTPLTPTPGTGSPRRPRSGWRRGRGGAP